jgi:hypothetical protein
MSLPLSVAIGVIIWMNMTHVESDWFGIRYLFVMLVCLIVGSLVTIVFSIISAVRKEYSFPMSVFFAFPSACFLSLLVFGVVKIFIANSENKALREEREKRIALLEEKFRKNPYIGIEERWFNVQPPYYAEIYKKTLKDNPDFFTIEQLEKIFDEVPVLREDILRSKACTEEFLQRNFHKIYNSNSTNLLEVLALKSNVPFQFLEKISQVRWPTGHVADRTLPKVLLDYYDPVLLLSSEEEKLDGRRSSSIAEEIYTKKKSENKLNGEFIDRDCSLEKTILNETLHHWIGQAERGILLIQHIDSLGIKEQEILADMLTSKDGHKANFQLICATASGKDSSELEREGKISPKLLATFGKHIYRTEKWWNGRALREKTGEDNGGSK